MTVSVKCSLQIKVYKRQSNEYLGSFPVVRVCNVSDISLLDAEVANISRGVLVDFLQGRGISRTEVSIKIKGCYLSV